MSDLLSHRDKLVLFCFNSIYIALFTAYYISVRNFEFLWYVAVMLFFFGLIVATFKYSHFPNFLLWGLSLWGLLHMAGGGVRIGDHALYAQQLFHVVGSGEMFILKYDQVVHAYGFAVAAFVVYHLFQPYFNERANWKVIYPLIVAASMGLGALNEIVEFTAVLFAGSHGVGGYFNTALDLVFNAFGAIVAVGIIHLRRKKNLSL